MKTDRTDPGSSGSREFTPIELLVAKPGEAMARRSYLSEDVVRRARPCPKTKRQSAIATWATAGTRAIRFTLIELLVVVGIIAILMALLLPVLSRAKYQAKLIVCTSNLRQTAMAVTMYVEESDSWYPHRKNVQNNKYSTPYILRYLGDATTDDTQTFQDLGLEEIVCPFNKVDWDDTSPSSIGAGYSYYFGWSAVDSGDPECRLLKVSQEMKFKGDTFDILTSDVFHQADQHGVILSGHPDYSAGILTPNSWAECWLSRDAVGRGPLDMNFLRTDGSVTRLDRLVPGVDERLRRLPYENGTYRDDNYNLLPPE